jgi:hypothetical protein
VLALGPDESSAKRTRNFVTNNNTADCRRRYQLDPLAAKVFCYRTTKLLGCRGILEHERALQIACAVKPAGEDEVPFKQRAGLPKFFYYFFRSHNPTSMKMQMHATIAAQWLCIRI